MGHATTEFYNLHQAWDNRNSLVDRQPLIRNNENL